MSYFQLDPKTSSLKSVIHGLSALGKNSLLWKCVCLLRSCFIQGLYSLSGKTSYRKISWSLEAARFGFNLFQSLWNLAGTSAALLPRCLSNFRAIRPLQHPISWLRDFTRFGGKTSSRLVNRGPDFVRCVFMLTYNQLFNNRFPINSLCPSDTTWRHRSRSASLQVVPGKPLPEPMLIPY